jgi:hypothetical protein
MAFLLPLQAVVCLTLQIAGPAHTHRAVASMVHAIGESWRPNNPVFRHRSTADAQRTALPPGFEWAASLRPRDSAEQLALATSPHGHRERHASARHRHAAADPSVEIDLDSGDREASVGSTGTGQGGADVIAWSTPLENLRWIAAAAEHPEAAAAQPWRDAVPRLPERPPRAV